MWRCTWISRSGDGQRWNHQLLAAIAQDMDTLQERMGEIMFVRELPPLQDW